MQMQNFIETKEERFIFIPVEILAEHDLIQWISLIIKLVAIYIPGILFITTPL